MTSVILYCNFLQDLTPLQYGSVGYDTYVSSLKTYVVGRERRMIDSVVGSSQPWSLSFSHNFMNYYAVTLRKLLTQMQ